MNEDKSLQDLYHDFRSKIDHEGGVEAALIYGLIAPDHFNDLHAVWCRFEHTYNALMELLGEYDEEFEYESC
jgi:hypothetical protein